MQTSTFTPSTRKVRRDATGGKRGRGHYLQREARRVRRPDPQRIEFEPTGAKLTSMAGLASFGAYVRRCGADAQLKAAFGDLKSGPRVVYPMDAQMRLFIDANVVGEGRVFGLEALAADPLFVRLAGGTVPSIDTMYRDLERLTEAEIGALEAIMAEHGLRRVRGCGRKLVHLDIDTTVEPLFGSQEGALPGPNPRYHGRPSYHPVLARVPEGNAVVGAKLRPGNTSFGAAEAELVASWVIRVRQAVGPRGLVVTRIDAAGDCTEVMSAIEDAGAKFICKARMTPDLCSAIAAIQQWRTVEDTADGRPAVQVAEVTFLRSEWREKQRVFRIVAVRSRERENGKQLYLWPDLDFTVQAYITNEFHESPEGIMYRYNDRAEIEPCIDEWKRDWGIGKVPSQSFLANHGAFLLKLLGYNLLRAFVAECFAALRSWRTSWLRRAIICTVGRLVRCGRRWKLRVPQASSLLNPALLDCS